MAFFFFLLKMFTFGFRCSKLQLKSQDEFAIFQQLIFHKHLSSYFKILVLSNQCQCKTAFAACDLCPKHALQTNRNKANCLQSSLLFLCAITHAFDTERNCLKRRLGLIILRYHIAVAFCIIILKPCFH